MSSKNFKISIVVPIYNEADYLYRSINSLINQIYTNLEILLVNDGSTDNSLEIIKKYAKADKRIKIINKNNGGLVDATITGIKYATGDYICFLDPDDYIGLDFIDNFINLILKYGKLDFYAAGFYQDNNGEHFPYSLRENNVFDIKKIRKLRSKFLFDGTNLTSNYIFISRWNKMYKTSVLKNLIKLFSNFKDVDLGEDTIFNFIMLNFSKTGMATTFINSYYYNIGNQNSMMNSSNVEAHYQKALTAYTKFKELLHSNGVSENQAYILYYDLLASLIEKNKNNVLLMNSILKRIKKDKVYQKSERILLQSNISKRQKTKIILFNVLGNYKLYVKIKNITKLLFHKKRNIVYLLKSCLKNGLKRGFNKYKFYSSRNKAFSDVEKQLPIIEKRISPIIEEFDNKETSLEKTSIEKNIFIFWWDGLENAPTIVKICVESVKNNYPDYKIIIITKNNFKKYSNLNKIIVRDFEHGKISIQTFSDILRFNLLYNNGGMWTDATIFYREKYNLVENLKEKSFESICFNTSNNFLNYKDCSCSWSCYLIASRKNGLFAKVMNTIYEQYYLNYGSFPIYFFTDAALMISKIKHVDADVLNKVQKSDYNMFDLHKILNLEFYTKEFEDNTMIPQKLSWSIDISFNPKMKTNYEYLKEKLK